GDTARSQTRGTLDLAGREPGCWPPRPDRGRRVRVDASTCWPRLAGRGAAGQTVGKATRSAARRVAKRSPGSAARALAHGPRHQGPTASRPLTSPRPGLRPASRGAEAKPGTTADPRRISRHGSPSLPPKPPRIVACACRRAWHALIHLEAFDRGGA